MTFYSISKVMIFKLSYDMLTRKKMKFAIARNVVDVILFFFDLSPKEESLKITHAFFTILIFLN